MRISSIAEFQWARGIIRSLHVLTGIACDLGLFDPQRLVQEFIRLLPDLGRKAVGGVGMDDDDRALGAEQRVDRLGRADAIVDARDVEVRVASRAR